jgi:hypothetical protein
MPVAPSVNAGNGVPFMVGAGLVYEIIAAACSSPQTAEINADKRSTTLMKWVNIGLAQSALFIVIAASIDHPHAKAIAAGGGLAAVIMYASYVHANVSGLAKPGPGTES